MRRHPRLQRGITLLETMVTAVVLILGIAVVSSTVVAIVRLNRRNLAQSQAYTVAEWWLERLTLIGCDPTQSAGKQCLALEKMDRQNFTVYWNASGSPTTIAPPTSSTEKYRPYLVSIDVDPPSESTELGYPLLSRQVGGTGPDSYTLVNTHNVRVTVSWQDELSKTSYHAVALQTRVSP